MLMIALAVVLILLVVYQAGFSRGRASYSKELRGGRKYEKDNTKRTGAK